MAIVENGLRKQRRDNGGGREECRAAPTQLRYLSLLLSKRVCTEFVYAFLEGRLRSLSRGERLALRPPIGDLGRAAIPGSFIPLFEALNWTVSLDDLIKTHWSNELSAPVRWYETIPHGATVRAVRFVRNRVHHHWIDALTLADEDQDLPMRLASWLWLWRTELPPPPAGRQDAPGEALYREDLAGEPVIGALGRLTAIFGIALRTLHERGCVTSDLLTELLPAFEDFDPAAFSRGAVIGTESRPARPWSDLAPVGETNDRSEERSQDNGIAGAGLIRKPATVDGPQTGVVAHRVEESCLLGEPASS